MHKTFKIFLLLYLLVLLILALMPLTGYYAALGTLPVIGVYLYRRVILEERETGRVIGHGVFTFACAVFLVGFAGNMMCTLYTTWRMREFREGIEGEKKKIYGQIQ